MAKQKTEVRISLADVKYIYGTSLGNFKRTVKSMFCMVCKAPYNSELTNFKILLNDLNDLELEGHCKECGNKIGRYIETGEVEQYVSRIETIRITKKHEK
jgi:RNase P subunit RPR2